MASDKSSGPQNSGKSLRVRPKVNVLSGIVLSLAIGWSVWSCVCSRLALGVYQFEVEI